MRATFKVGTVPALLTATVVAALAIGGCGKSESAAPASGGGERVFLVDLAPAATREVEVTLDAVGTAYASGQVDIRPQVSGTLVAAPFVEGQDAEEGQILVQLDDSKAKASLALVQAQLDSARAKLKVASERLGRFRRLAAEDLVSREEFSTLESEEKAAAASVRENEAEVRLAQRQLEDYTLRAPISGRMGIRYIDEGNFVEAGTIISTLVAADPVEVLFTLPSAVMSEVKVGQDAQIRATDAAKTLLGVGRVRVIDARVDTDTRMVRVKALVPNPEGTIQAGQFVTVSLVRENRPKAVVVPEEAVIPFGGKTYLYVVTNDQAVRREVELGVRLPEVVEIRSGLSGGETIVIRGQHRLGESAKVKQRDAGLPETGGTGAAGTDNSRPANAGDSRPVNAGEANSLDAGEANSAKD